MNEKQASYNAATTRTEYTKILKRVEAGERVLLTRYNIPVAAMVPVQDLKRLEADPKNGKKSA